MPEKQLHPDRKSLVIGLGGTGKSCLVQLKRLVVEHGYADTTRQSDIRLLCLDFDPAEATCRTRIEPAREISLEATEMHTLDGDLIQTRLQHMDELSIKDYYNYWYPDPEGEIIALGAQRAGAAQWRPLGRIGFFEHVVNIKAELEEAVNQLTQADPSQDLHYNADREGKIYLVSSLGGGTGSGLFWDVAFFLKKKFPRIQQTGLFLLPDIFEKYDQGGRLFANTYASLKELAAFANRRREFYARYPNRDVISPDVVKDAPLETIFLFDNKLGKVIRVNEINQVTGLMAETIFGDMEETRLSRAKASVDTNIRNGKAVSKMNELALQSVFNTIGTVTLTLPSPNEVNRQLARFYIKDILLNKLQQESDDYLQPNADKGPTDDEQILKNRPELFKWLKTELEKALDSEKNKSWDQGFLTRSAGEMAEELMKHGPAYEDMKAVVETWVKEFIDPRPDGCFTFPPKKLPEMDTKRETGLYGILSAARLNLTDKFTKELNDTGGTDRIEKARELSKFSLAAARWLRKQTLQTRQQLQDQLVNHGASLHELEDELSELVEAKPRQTGDFAFMAYRRWAIRFLRNIKENYGSVRYSV